MKNKTDHLLKAIGFLAVIAIIFGFTFESSPDMETKKKDFMVSDQIIMEEDMQNNNKASPLKKIILPYALDQDELNIKNNEEGWENSEYQVIHIEPLPDKKFCAIVMKTTKVPGGYTATVDLRLETKKHKYKISEATVKSSSKDHLDWIIDVTVTDDRDPNDEYAISHKKVMFKNKEGDMIDTIEFDEDQTMDLTLEPPYLDKRYYHLDFKEQEITDSLIGYNRICRIGLYKRLKNGIL